MQNRTLFPTEAGTPQGGIISPTLANLTLDGLGRLLKETFRPRKIRGKLFNPKVDFVRYADDFIITGCSRELLENEVKPLVEHFMLDRGLQFSPEKTCITHIEDGLRFPWAEPAQVWRQAPDYTLRKEHARLSGEGA